MSQIGKIYFFPLIYFVLLAKFYVNCILNDALLWVRAGGRTQNITKNIYGNLENSSKFKIGI